MFLSAMALSNEINQDMIFPTQYIKGLLIKIYDYAIWHNIEIQNQKPTKSGSARTLLIAKKI